MTLRKVNTIGSRGISQKDRSSENEDACNRVGRAERTTESCAWSKPNLLTSTRTGVWPEFRLVPVRRPPRRSRSMHFGTVTYTRRTTRELAWTTWPEKHTPRGMTGKPKLRFLKNFGVERVSGERQIFRKFVCFFCVCNSGKCPNFQNDVCHHKCILPKPFNCV